MGFFSNVFGFPERSYQETQSSLLDIATFIPVPTPYYYRERCEFDVGDGVNKKKKKQNNSNTNTNTNNIITAGIFSTPSVEELRQMAAYVYTTNAATIQEYYQSQNPTTTTTTVRNMIGESRELHTTLKSTSTAASSTAAVFQAASQFNYLEMPHPERTPEAGITAYEDDPTQGPACAVACGAGTAYRNYLVPVELFSTRPSLSSTASTITTSTTASTSATSRRGQRAQCQLNGLDEIERYVQEQQCSSCTEKNNGVVSVPVPWIVKNGYIEAASIETLERFNAQLLASSSSSSNNNNNNNNLREVFISKIKIGLQEDTTVTDRIATNIGSPPRDRTILSSFTAGFGKNNSADPATPPQSTRSRRSSSCGSRRTAAVVVTQTYNSAISIGYSHRATTEQWEPIARTVLEATYEATLLVGIIKTMEAIVRTRSSSSSTTTTNHPNTDAPPCALPPIYLTKVGGGVFGNKPQWIVDAIQSALHRVCTTPRDNDNDNNTNTNNIDDTTYKGRIGLDIRIVHYRGIDPLYEQLEQYKYDGVR